MLKKIHCLLLLAAAFFCSPIAGWDSARAEEKNRVFEIRTYYANEGKLDALLARFRDHTVALFEKHGMTNVGYWVPSDNKENKLVYMLAFPSREARNKAFKAFLADPAWQKAFKASTKDGRLVKKIVSDFLTGTDFSKIK
ncbi:MAG: NIPSNAP family protein [Verrucomicrobia bacterium]|nr:NIPSNAP family protein [Verrucomicrobiota bacterium]